MKRDIFFPEADIPVVVVPKTYPDGYTIGWHNHDYCQLVYACSGVMVVEAEQSLWVIPPQRAVWIPAGISHKVEMYGLAEMRNVYLKPHCSPHLPNSSTVVNVSSLLGEIIAYMTTGRFEQGNTGEKERLVAVLLDQLKIADQAELSLPLAEDKRLVRVCESIMAQPADCQSLSDWSKSLNISSRTLSRLFRQEMGMSFIEYRNQVRLFQALKRLASGQSVTSVALDVGFVSLSAFNRLFKRHFGTTPGHYFQQIE